MCDLNLLKAHIDSIVYQFLWQGGFNLMFAELSLCNMEPSGHVRLKLFRPLTGLSWAWTFYKDFRLNVGVLQDYTSFGIIIFH